MLQVGEELTRLTTNLQVGLGPKLNNQAPLGVSSPVSPACPLGVSSPVSPAYTVYLCITVLCCAVQARLHSLHHSVSCLPPLTTTRPHQVCRLLSRLSSLSPLPVLFVVPHSVLCCAGGQAVVPPNNNELGVSSPVSPVSPVSPTCTVCCASLCAVLCCCADGQAVGQAVVPPNNNELGMSSPVSPVSLSPLPVLFAVPHSVCVLCSGAPQALHRPHQPRGDGGPRGPRFGCVI
eukprot:SAG11_NODE_1043_length_6052_cov_7.005711_4_plen_234_part_00